MYDKSGLKILKIKGKGGANKIFQNQFDWDETSSWIKGSIFLNTRIHSEWGKIRREYSKSSYKCEEICFAARKSAGKFLGEKIREMGMGLSLCLAFSREKIPPNKYDIHVIIFSRPF